MVFANFYQSSFYIKQTVLDISDLYLLKYHVSLNHTQNSHTWHSHDHTRQQNSTEACSNAFFEIQLQYTWCQNSSPRSCSQNMNSNKKNQRKKHTFSRQNVKKLPMYFLSFPFVYYLLEFISSSHFLNASTVNWYGVFPPSHCISFSSVNSISIFILLSKSKLSLILCFINRHVLFGRVSVLFDIFFIIWLFTSLFIIRFRYNYDIGGELWILTSLTFWIFYFNYVMLFYCFV